MVAIFCLYSDCEKDHNKTSGQFYLGLKNNVKMCIAFHFKEEGITVEKYTYSPTQSC